MTWVILSHLALLLLGVALGVRLERKDAELFLEERRRYGRP